MFHLGASVAGSPVSGLIQTLQEQLLRLKLILQRLVKVLLPSIYDSPHENGRSWLKAGQNYTRIFEPWIRTDELFAEL